MRTTTRRNAKKSRPQKKWPGILLLVLGGLVIVFAAYALTKPFRDFNHHSESFGPFVRKVGDPEFKPPADIWSDKNLKLYNEKGVGIKPTEFTKILPNGKRIPKKFELEEWKHYQEDQYNSERRNKVKEARAEFDRLVKWLNTRDPLNRKVLVIVDDTGRITTADSHLIRDRIGQLGLEEGVTEGDTVEFRGCLISASRFENCQLVNIKQSETGKLADLKTLTGWLYHERPEAPATSLVQGLANIFTALADSHNLPEEMLVFSDGLENDKDTGLSFYKTPELLAKDKRTELYKALESRKPFPQLPGVHVTWYGPRRGEGRERQLIDQALDAWKDFLGSKTAEVSVRYE